MEKERMHNP